MSDDDNNNNNNNKTQKKGRRRRRFSVYRVFSSTKMYNKIHNNNINK